MPIIITPNDPSQDIDSVLNYGVDHRRDVSSKSKQMNSKDEAISTTSECVVTIIAGFSIHQSSLVKSEWEIGMPLPSITNYLRRGINEFLGRIVEHIKTSFPDITNEDEERAKTLIGNANNMVFHGKEEFQNQFVWNAKPMTGVLISEDHVLTCGHIDEGEGDDDGRFLKNPSNSFIILGFRTGDIPKADTVLKGWQVRQIEKVQIVPWTISEHVDPAEIGSESRFDVLVLKLRPQGTQSQAIPKVAVATEPPKVGDKICTIGNPLGMTFKYSEGPITEYFNKQREATHPFFAANLETFPGNSGSPIFKQDDGGNLLPLPQIIGLHHGCGNVPISEEIINSRAIAKDLRGLLIKYAHSTEDKEVLDTICLSSFYDTSNCVVIDNNRTAFTLDKILQKDMNQDAICFNTRVDPIGNAMRTFYAFAPIASHPELAAPVNFASVEFTLEFPSNVTTARTFGFSVAGHMLVRGDFKTNANSFVHIFAQFGGNNIQQEEHKASIHTTATGASIAAILQGAELKDLGTLEGYGGGMGLLGWTEKGFFQIDWPLQPKAATVLVTYKRATGIAKMPVEVLTFTGSAIFEKMSPSGYQGQVDIWKGPVLDKSIHALPQ